jgi:hypothetical protein
VLSAAALADNAVLTIAALSIATPPRRTERARGRFGRVMGTALVVDAAS